MRFKKTSFSGRLFKKFTTKFLSIIWGRSKSSFKKTITACALLRRPSFFMGIFFYACHFQMTDSLSFRNESHRLIIDLRVINHRQNYRFEMMPHCRFEMVDWLSFRNDDGSLFEMMDGLSLRKIDGFPFDMKMMLSSRGKDLRPSVYFRNDSHFSYHRRKMLCPVVFTFKRTDNFKERPYIFGNDSSFRNDRLPPKTLEILSFIKDR